jgi:hypothetical protein
MKIRGGSHEENNSTISSVPCSIYTDGSTVKLTSNKEIIKTILLKERYYGDKSFGC